MTLTAPEMLLESSADPRHACHYCLSTGAPRHSSDTAYNTRTFRFSFCLTSTCASAFTPNAASFHVSHQQQQRQPHNLRQELSKAHGRHLADGFSIIARTTSIALRSIDCDEHRLYLLICESLRSTQDSQFRDSSLAVGKDQICQVGDACLALCQSLWLVHKQYRDYGQAERTAEAHSLGDLQQQRKSVSDDSRQQNVSQQVPCRRSFAR